MQQEIGSVTRDTDIPVFGLNSGGDVARLLDVNAYVGMDEYLGGSVAGQYFVMSGISESSQGLYVNSQINNIALQERYLGLSENVGGLFFETLVVDGTSQEDMTAKLQQAMVGCPYTHILLSTSSSLANTVQAIKDAGCSFESIVMGTFDVSEVVYTGIANNELDFTISQQTYLQGSLPVVLATLFSTTGRTLAASSESRNGIYLSGPTLINGTNLPSPEQQVCQFEAFPICPNNKNPLGEMAECPCIDRSQIKIRGITHGVSTDPFWDQVYAAMGQAAEDFGVDLVAIRLDPSETNEAVYEQMAGQVRALCSEEIDGLFVSIPSQDVADALSTCQQNNIPVISINAGSSQAKELGLLNHVGQVEFSAGKIAGERMIEMGVTRGFCLRHEVNNTALLDRCNGMKEAFDESTRSVEFLGATDVPPDNTNQYISAVNALVGESGSWDGLGVLLGGAIQVPMAIALKEQHPGLVMATFDTSDEVFEAINAGNILFGVDQNAYLQGYFPIPLLAWKTYAQEALAATFFETGPRLVMTSPSNVEVECQNNYYGTCAPQDYPDDDTLGSLGSGSTRLDCLVGLILGLFSSLPIFLM